MEIDGSKSFYDTKEWKEIRKIPHLRGCLGMALEDKLNRENHLSQTEDSGNVL